MEAPMGILLVAAGISSGLIRTLIMLIMLDHKPGHGSGQEIRSFLAPDPLYGVLSRAFSDYHAASGT